MTLIVGPNLSLDQTVEVPRLYVGTIHRVAEVVRLAGGKGGNVARALAILGGEPLLCGFVGGPVGELVEAYLTEGKIAHRLVPTRGETRVCFTIANRSTRAQTEFYEAGAPVTTDEVDALLAAMDACLVGQRWVVITGSLPPGAPNDLYATMIQMAHGRGARVVLDAKDLPLLYAVAAGPDILKINRLELSAYVSRLVREPADVAAAAAGTIRLPGAERVRPPQPDRDLPDSHLPTERAAIITLGEWGAVVVSAAGRWHVPAPPAKTRVRSPVGSGDSAAAGVVLGLERGLGLLDAVRMGVAAGTANACHLGGARFGRAEAERLMAACVTEPPAVIQLPATGG